MKLKPYSRNVIFFDTEFSGNDISTGDLLSIGMVRVTGEELYLEMKHNGPVSPWVKKHILPTLKDKPLNRKNAVKKLISFVGESKPYLVSYRMQYDTVYLHKLFGYNRTQKDSGSRRGDVADFESL